MAFGALVAGLMSVSCVFPFVAMPFQANALRPEIQSYESRRAELRPGRQRDAALEKVPVRIGDAQPGSVDPRKVGRLDVRHLQAGDLRDALSPPDPGWRAG
jgi:hypothetical protein